MNVKHARWQAVAIAALLCTVGNAPAEQTSVGVDPKLGEFVDLDLTFYDETGKAAALGEIIDGPTALTLVYFRCPGICTPLLNAMAETMDEVAQDYDLVAGQDYRHLTISFDPRERDVPDMAQNKQRALLASLEHKIEPAGWRFMTGEPENITALTDQVGFRYVQTNQDFSHKGVVIFLSKQGKIVSYLDGGPKVSSIGQQEPKPTLLPMELKLALNDAAAGTPRSLMTKLQGLCYRYDPNTKKYGLMINRIILGVGVVTLLVFGGFLFILGKAKKPHDNFSVKR